MEGHKKEKTKNNTVMCYRFRLFRLHIGLLLLLLYANRSFGSTPTQATISSIDNRSLRSTFRRLSASLSNTIETTETKLNSSQLKRIKNSESKKISSNSGLIVKEKNNVAENSQDKEELQESKVVDKDSASRQKHSTGGNTLDHNSSDTLQEEERGAMRRGPFGFFKPINKIKGNNCTTLTAQKEGSNNTSVDETSDESNEEKVKSSVNSTKEDTNVTTVEENSQSVPASAGNMTPMLKPSYIMMNSHPNYPMQRPGNVHMHTRPAADKQMLIASSVVGVFNIATRAWLLFWIAKRMSSEEELLAPRQHFRWERLNDKYIRDHAVLQSVLTIPPAGFTRLRWRKFLKSLRSKTDRKKSDPHVLPTRNVVVVEVAPKGEIDMEYITNFVNFIIAAHKKAQFGSDPEIVLLLQSPGGAVTTFGLATAQVGRLKELGLNVTICVDNVAASGGYMIASQATQLIAAPFAYVGSIGVIVERFNINKLLNTIGVKPLELTAGENKRRLSLINEVSKEDIAEESKQLERTHKAFIDLCLEARPSLDLNICDGTVLIASDGISHGLVDRILTSDEYIWECIQDNAHVLKLCKASDIHPNFVFYQLLNLIPHYLKEKMSKIDFNQILTIGLNGIALGSMVIAKLK